MKLLALLAFSTFVVAGCTSTDERVATADDERVAVADAVAAGDTCRTVIVGRSGDVACGNAEQWADFDRRAALINAGVTCRSASETPALTATSRLAPQELCMTAEQWAVLDRRVFGAAAGQGRDEQADNSAQLGFAMDQAAQLQAQFDASPGQMQAPAQ